MLHKCSACDTIYLVSEFRNLCQPCGLEAQARVERLLEEDGSVEWWRLAIEATHGADRIKERRWQIR